MIVMLSGIGLAIAFIVAGAIIVVGKLKPLSARAKNLEASLGKIPIAQATRDLERLQVAVQGLQTLSLRLPRKGPTA